MILCHESFVLIQPPLVIFTLAIAIVMCPEVYSVIIRFEMSLKSKSVKRPHPEPAGPVKEHQASLAPPPTEPDYRVSRPANSSGQSWYTSDIHSSFTILMFLI